MYVYIYIYIYIHIYTIYILYIINYICYIKKEVCYTRWNSICNCFMKCTYNTKREFLQLFQKTLLMIISQIRHSKKKVHKHYHSAHLHIRAHLSSQNIFFGKYNQTFWVVTSIRSSQRRCSVRKGFLRNLAKFPRKTPVPESLFLIKFQVLLATLLKKETLAQVFSCEFYEIPKNTFFTEHLWATASQLSPSRHAVFREYSLSVSISLAMFRASREHLGNIKQTTFYKILDGKVVFLDGKEYHLTITNVNLLANSSNHKGMFPEYSKNILRISFSKIFQGYPRNIVIL